MHAPALIVARHVQILPVEVNLIVTGFRADTGEPIRQFAQHNLVTLAGRNLVRSRLKDSSAAVLSHFALGTDATPVTSASTSLVTEVHRDVLTTIKEADGQLLLKYFLASTTANGHTLRKAALFNAASDGTMFAAALLSEAIEKTADEAYTFDWTININAPS